MALAASNRKASHISLMKQNRKRLLRLIKHSKQTVRGESILFIDAVHPTQATKISHGWIRKAQNKTIETTGSRRCLNLIGALNLTNIGDTIINGYETINSDMVRDDAFVLNTELHYLPPYSPNLNPIERLGKVVSEHSRNNVYFKTKREFRDAIRTFLR